MTADLASAGVNSVGVITGLIVNCKDGQPALITLPHGINKKIKYETNNKVMSVIGSHLT